VQIPERLIDFRCYGADATEFLGMTDVELPAFEAMTETISGGGIAGEVESVVLGHFKSMSVKLKFRTPTEKAVALLAPVRQVIDIRGSIQMQDTQGGPLVTKSLRVECSGQVKHKAFGKLEPGKPMASEVDLEIATIRISVGGVLLVELDKFNSIFRVNNVDYLKQVRTDLGGL
jgi:P2 family phage contractile tail tube protein